MTNPTTSPEAVNVPHVRASFINALSEEGTKEEVIQWLQKTWNERCALAAGNDLLITDRDLWKAKAEVQGYIRMKDELERKTASNNLWEAMNQTKDQKIAELEAQPEPYGPNDGWIKEDDEGTFSPASSDNDVIYMGGRKYVAVDTQPEPVVQVKPLEWVDTGSYLIKAGDYCIRKSPSETHCRLFFGSEYLAYSAEKDKLKEIAQADYAKRTLSDITTRSEADVWEEAAKIADEIKNRNGEAVFGSWDSGFKVACERIAAALRERGKV